MIARGSKLSSDFKLVDLSGNSAKADYDTWAYGISAEYGYRQNLNAGWFIEPQAELSLGHIGSAGYEMSNGARIENEGVDSAVVRLGFLGGKEFTIGGRTSKHRPCTTLAATAAQQPITERTAWPCRQAT